MRVFHSTNGKVQGGQLEAAVALASEAAKLLGAHGGEIRFYLSLAGGEDVNGTLFSQEYESPEALGAAIDALADNAELQALAARLNGPGSPVVITSQSMGMDLPLGRTPKAGRGSILEVHTSHINPGRFEKAVAESAEVCAFVEANGAVNARAIQLTYAGMASGLLALVWEHENMAAQARTASAWFTDEGVALQMRSMGATPATTRVASALYNEVPI
ncbi:MAG TPA: hypothetical protein VEJ84_22970 [Acidimicrobiales bacterium]|nr:hypothetical protein [Acidimicrobiales bacterium]